MSYKNESVNGKLAVQLLIKEKFISKKLPLNNTDVLVNEIIIGNSKIFIFVQYLHPLDKER